MKLSATPADRFRAAQGADLPDPAEQGLAHAAVAARLADRFRLHQQLPGLSILLTDEELAVLHACLRTAGHLQTHESLMQAYEASLAQKLAREEWNQVRVQWWLCGIILTVQAWDLSVKFLQALLP